MKVKVRAARVHGFILLGSYVYLALPVLVFMLGWCRWYVGIPGAIVLVLSVLSCFREQRRLAGTRHGPAGIWHGLAGTRHGPAGIWHGLAGTRHGLAGTRHGLAGTRRGLAGIRCGQGDDSRAGKSMDLRLWSDGQYVLASAQWVKAAAIIVVILLWTGLSGVGGYVWQNADHPVRNELFVLLVEEKWPLVKEMASASGSGSRGLVYYIGYWLPAALAGKLSGLEAGWAVQYLWAVAGILLLYAWICIWRRKLAVWPLWIVIFFSGLDAVGVLLGCREELRIFGDVHLEAWAPYYQFSSMTTQLFWVFNQAVPAWLLAAVIFLVEKPRNMVFLASLAILTSTFPFVGLLPYVLYFMITRSGWEEGCRNIRALLKNCLGNWCSLQNVAGSAVTVLVCGIYIAGNNAVRNSLPFLNSGRRFFLLAAGAALAAAGLWAAALLAMRGKGRLVFGAAAVSGTAAVILRFATLPYADWQSPLFYWISHTLFYMAEAGVFLVVLYPLVKDKRLFVLNAVWLYVIPLIQVGRSCDFCMRASIPGLFLILLWCVHALDTDGRKKRPYRSLLLVLLLAAGAVTPLHEMKRTFVNTREYYENRTAGEDEVFWGNNFSGSTKGFFWRYLAGTHPAEKGGGQD